MYSFKDKGDNDITLRPEGTASVCRAYIQHGMQNRPQPVKLYYLTSIFRYERPQAGRLREHHQFGYEAIGDSDPVIDAEVIEMAWRFYAELGLKKLNLLINSIGCPNCRPAYLVELKNYYISHTDELCGDCKIRWRKNYPAFARLQAAQLSASDSCSSQKRRLPVPRMQRALRYTQKISYEAGPAFYRSSRRVRGFDYYPVRCSKSSLRQRSSEHYRRRRPL